MIREIIAAKTASETTSEINCTGENVPATFFADGLSGAEEIVIQYKNADATFADIYQEGSKLVLTATSNINTAYGPGYYRLVKPSTSAATSVSLTSEAHR